MARLNESQTVLDRSDSSDSDEEVYFDKGDDEPSPSNLRDLYIPRQMWEDMGNPDKITVTVVPGDALNEEDRDG